MSATNGPVIDGTYRMPVSGSKAAPCQSAPPTEPGSWIVPFVSFGPSAFDRRRREHRTDHVALHDVERRGAQLRREVDEIVNRDALPIERRRLGWKRLRRRRLFARCRRLRHRPFFDRPHRLSVDAIEDERKCLLRDLDDSLDRPAVNGDVGEHGRGRQIVVPEIVMDELVVPDALARQAVDGDEAVAEQVVARAGARRTCHSWGW